MNPHTGEIRQFATRFEAEEAGFTLPLTDEQKVVFVDWTPEQRVERVGKPFNRRERRRRRKLERQRKR